MRLPIRLPVHHPRQKWIAAAVIAIAVTVIASVARYAPDRSPMEPADEVLYDALYRLRTPEDRRDGNVVILAVDAYALKELKDENVLKLNRRGLGWPWPRTTWAVLIPYLERQGAKAVAFDLLFNEPSVY